MSYRLMQIFLIIHLGCTVAGAGEISLNRTSEYVIKIAGEEISRVELEKELVRIIRYKGNETENIVKCIDSFINRAYLVAAAIDEGCDSDVSLQQEIHQEAIRLMVSEDKPLYNWVLSEHDDIRSAELQNAYKRRSHKYKISYLVFRSYQDLISLCGADTVGITMVKYNRLINASKNEQFASSGSVDLQWPFTLFINNQDEIYDYRVGDISHPLKHGHNWIIVRIESITPVTQRSFFEEKKNIENLLIQDKRIRYLASFDEQIHKEANTSIDYNVVHLVFEKHLKSVRSDIIDEYLLKNIGNIILATYSISGKQCVMTIGDYVEYYNNMPMRKAITDEMMCLNYVYEYIYGECAFNEAKKLKLDEIPDYKKAVTDYKHRTYIKHYENTILRKKLVINNDDIKNYYNRNLEIFYDGERAYLSYVVFSSLADAFEFVIDVEDTDVDSLYNKLNDHTYVPKADSICTDIYLEYDDPQWLTTRIRDIITHLESKKISSPIEINNLYYVFIKYRETGKRIKPLSEVRAWIEDVLYRQKVERYKEEMQPCWKKKYVLIDNIDYEKYTSPEWIEKVIKNPKSILGISGNAR